MPLELHVWGPAFGLPSIEAECIAAIAYMNKAVPRGGWVVIASHDASISPNREFPALRDDGHWIAGYEAIVAYLGSHEDGPFTLDSELDSQQRADTIAFSSFLRWNALPLLDLSLYTSFQNFYHTTRPAYSALLPWHANYTIPPARRDTARARTAHLGLSGLDIDNVHEDRSGAGGGIHSSYEAAKREAGIPTENNLPSPAFPLGRNKGIQSLLNRPEYTARFKLDTLAAACLEPLDKLLEDKRYLLSDTVVTSLDCLALGYLSLMIYPDVRQPWLPESIRRRYPRLERFTRRLRDNLIGRPINAASVEVIASASDIDPGATLHLPWSITPASSIPQTALSLSTSVLSRLPLLSSYFTSPIYYQTPPPPRNYLHTALNILSTTAAAVFVSSVYYSHTHPARHKEEELIIDAPLRHSWSTDVHARHPAQQPSENTSWFSGGGFAAEDLLRQGFGMDFGSGMDIDQQEPKVGLDGEGPAEQREHERAGDVAVEVEVDVDLEPKKSRWW